MPIYEYICKDCGHELEVLQGFRDSPLTECSACSAQALRKKLSAAAFHLKGTGWYETDFKNKDEKSKEKSDTPAASSTESNDKADSGSSKKQSDTKSKSSNSENASSSAVT